MSANSTQTALLTFSLGPVHSFISQARRVADLWAGSTILSTLAAAAVRALTSLHGKLIFPVAGDTIPEALPNRFVARVPVDDAAGIALAVEAAVRNEWSRMIDGARAKLRAPLALDNELECAAALEALQCSWSWVAETGDYAGDSRRGAEQFAASRMYRPFPAITAHGVKCAVCGERTALPDGDRVHVAEAWKRAFDEAEKRGIGAFFRPGQGRLCLVCATKRLFPLLAGTRQVYESFPDFRPHDNRPYFAVVTMDGDRLGAALSGAGSSAFPLAELQARLSSALTAFATALRSPRGTNLNVTVETKGTRPQLIYAGGEDVLFLADPRDALPAAIDVRNQYVEALRTQGLDPVQHTISAAILYAHTRTPAGTVFREAERLLKEQAKHAAGRDAIAMSLDKGVGTPAQVAFKWDDPLLRNLESLTSDVASEAMSSRQTYMLAEEGRMLVDVLAESDWERWLTARLTGAEVRDAAAAAALIAPFFTTGRIDALRIARFIAMETK